MLTTNPIPQGTSLSQRIRWSQLIDRTDYLKNIPDTLMAVWSTSCVERALQVQHELGLVVAPFLWLGLETKRQWLIGQVCDQKLGDTRAKVEGMIAQKWGLRTGGSGTPEWDLHRAVWHLLRTDRTGVDFANDYALKAVIAHLFDVASQTQEMWVQRQMLMEIVEKWETDKERRRNEILSQFREGLEAALF